MEEDDKIAAMFKNTLHAYSQPLKNEEIETMREFITRKSFFKFSAYTFNVYYASAIFSGFLISLLLGSHYIYTQIYQFDDVYVRQKNIEMGSSEIKNKTIIVEDKRNGGLRSTDDKKRIWSLLLDTNKRTSSRDFSSPKPNTKSASADRIGTMQKSSDQILPNSDLSNDQSGQKQGMEDNILTLPNDSPGIPPILHMEIVDSSDKKSQVKTRRQVIIIKTDTIFQIDTVRGRISKKRKK